MRFHTRLLTAAAVLLGTAFGAQAQEVRVARRTALPTPADDHAGPAEKQPRLGAGSSHLAASPAARENDALLRNLDFAVVARRPPTSGPHAARNRAGIAARTRADVPESRNPAIQSVKDFSDKDRIVVSGVKVSTQAVVLQMAAAKAWGPKEFDRLDKLTVAMPLSDSMALMLSGKGDVTGDFTVPPFSFREMKAGMKPVIDTFSVLGGPSSTNVIYATKKYADANPKMVQAFGAALREAQEAIGKDKKTAAATYLKLSGDKESVDNVVEMLNDPKVEFSPTPKGIMAFADFMHGTGAIKAKPASWKDAFIPELHAAPGN